MHVENFGYINIKIIRGGKIIEEYQKQTHIVYGNCGMFDNSSLGFLHNIQP
jgi:hypothetical protein